MTPTVWWLVFGAAVALELITGTFYLLLVAVGLAAGALAAHAEVSVATQVTIAALVGALAVGLGHANRRRRPAALPPAGNRDVHLDIGQAVQVAAWNEDRTASVHHRGASWTAVLAEGESPAAGRHEIVSVVGNRLVLRRI